jgi:hypothetical protein
MSWFALFNVRSCSTYQLAELYTFISKCRIGKNQKDFELPINTNFNVLLFTLVFCVLMLGGSAHHRADGCLRDERTMATASSGVEEPEPGGALVEDNEAEGGRPVWRSPAWRRSAAQRRLGSRDSDGDGHGRWARQRR